jgi:hypothetical protein
MEIRQRLRVLVVLSGNWVLAQLKSARTLAELQPGPQKLSLEEIELRRFVRDNAREGDEALVKMNDGVLPHS